MPHPHEHRCAHHRVSVQRCRPCDNLHDCGDMPRLSTVDAILAQQFYEKSPYISRDPRRCVGDPPAARGEKDHRPSIARWSGWGHRGDVRDALDWALPSVVGTGDGPPALTPADLTLLGWGSEPTTPNQPPASPNAHWGCTTGAFSC